jgi:hypothetical protein
VDRANHLVLVVVVEDWIHHVQILGEDLHKASYREEGEGNLLVVEEGQGIMEDRGKGSDYLVGRNLGEDASKEHLVAEEVVEGDRIVRNEDQIDEIGFAVEVAGEPFLNVDWDLNL